MRYVLHPSLLFLCFIFLLLFFFHVPPPPEIYTLSLHDALPIWNCSARSLQAFAGFGDGFVGSSAPCAVSVGPFAARAGSVGRSEEHTSELQSRGHLVCRLLLEKKKKKQVK